jgi:hypothetical protein
LTVAHHSVLPDGRFVIINTSNNDANYFNNTKPITYDYGFEGYLITPINATTSKVEAVDDAFNYGSFINKVSKGTTKSMWVHIKKVKEFIENNRQRRLERERTSNTSLRTAEPE